MPHTIDRILENAVGPTGARLNENGPRYEVLDINALIAEHDARGLPRRTGSMGWARDEMIKHLYDNDAGLPLVYAPGS